MKPETKVLEREKLEAASAVQAGHAVLAQK